jgi:hypothetical protein
MEIHHNLQRGNDHNASLMQIGGLHTDQPRSLLRFAYALLLSHILHRKGIGCHDKSEKDMKSKVIVKEDILLRLLQLPKKRKLKRKMLLRSFQFLKKKKTEEGDVAVDIPKNYVCYVVYFPTLKKGEKQDTFEAAAHTVVAGKRNPFGIITRI